MGLYLGGLIIGRIFASVISGAYFPRGLFFGGGGGGGGAYYRNFTVYMHLTKMKQSDWLISLPLVFQSKIGLLDRNFVVAQCHSFWPPVNFSAS